MARRHHSWEERASQQRFRHLRTIVSGLLLPAPGQSGVDGRHTATMGTGASRGEPKPKDIVFYNNPIHPDCMIPPGATYERDLDGIALGNNCNRVWVVDTTCR